MAGLRITGGEVLGPDGLAAGDLCVAGGRFAEPRGDERELRADGMWLLPGMVDLHGDGFERHLAPRRGMVTDLAAGLAAAEAEIAAAGVTTAWLAQFWSWEGGMRGPDFAARLAAAWAAGRAAGAWAVDLRLQLRVETHLVEDGSAIRRLVAAHGVDYVVFNDHLPHAALDAGRRPPRLAGQAAKAGRSPEAHWAELRRLAARGPEVPGFCAALARDLAASGVRLGSHDDADAAARAAWRARGVAISEFPVTPEAAAEAARGGETVVMGAPNAVRGGSHKRGGMAASALLREGRVTALASDYHYPALAAAAFGLSAAIGLAAAWALVSERPAAAMGLHDRGRIAPGLRADLVVWDPAAGRVAGTFAAGRPVHMAKRLAEAALAG